MGYKIIIQTERDGQIKEEINESVDFIKEAIQRIDAYTEHGVSGIRKSKIISIIILRED